MREVIGPSGLYPTVHLELLRTTNAQNGPGQYPESLGRNLGAAAIAHSVTLLIELF